MYLQLAAPYALVILGNLTILRQWKVIEYFPEINSYSVTYSIEEDVEQVTGHGTRGCFPQG